MPTVRVDKEGLTLDYVVWQACQDPAASLVEETLNLNRGLAEQPLFLPVGLEIVVPERRAPVVPVRQVVRLWD